MNSTTSPALTSILSTLGQDASKLTDSDKSAITTLLTERGEIAPEHTGRLSGNTKRINVILGKRTGRTIVFTTRKSSAAKLPATKANLAKLTAARDTTPRWEPGKRAALTKAIREMASALKA